MSMLYDYVQMDQINSQEYNSFEMYMVTIKTSMIEYHYWVLNKRSGSPLILIQQFVGRN